MQEDSAAKTDTRIKEYNYKDIVDPTELGEGGQATALLCTFKGSHTPLVIKQFFRDNEWTDELETEIHNLIETITGPNVVRLFGILVNNRRKIGIVMEYCEDGSLDKVVKNPKDYYTYDSILEWMLQATNGIQFLHERGIIHRDVKPANMLLSHSRKRLKLSDMSPSTWTGENQYENTFNGRGTPGFRAWEIEDGEDYTYAVDIFSLGRSLWNLLYRQASKNSGDHTFENLYTQYLQSPNEYYDLLKEKLREDNVNYCRSLGYSTTLRTHFLRIIAKMTAPIQEGRLNVTDTYSELSMLKEFEDLTADISQIKTLHPVYKRSDIRLLKEIAEGGTGCAALVNIGDDRCPVAYKEYHEYHKFNIYSLGCVSNEVFALCTLSSHVNIVRLLGMTKQGPLVTGLLLEYCEGGDLWHHIREDSYQAIEKNILYWMMQAASALLFAHQSGFVHCEVKPSKRPRDDQEVELSLHQRSNVKVSNDLFEFMIKMMSLEATDRPTMESVHTFLGTRFEEADE